jgi:hypothetical protein
LGGAFLLPPPADIAHRTGILFDYLVCAGEQSQSPQHSLSEQVTGSVSPSACNSSEFRTMSNWLYNLPTGWMTLIVFGFTFLIAAAIQAIVRILAVGERARSFKAVSPSMLPPLGAIFALFIAFTAVQVWSDNDRASVAVSREASALRAVVVLASIFPGEPETRLHGLIRRYIEEVAIQEWPMMARHTATLRIAPLPLVEALQLTLALPSGTPGQGIAQREIAVALENALDARRQRIILSEARVSLVKWGCLVVQALCALLAIALVHSDNRLASTITMAIFAAGVAASVLLIAAHDQPFTGQISPEPLLQVMPEAARTALRISP